MTIKLHLSYLRMQYAERVTQYCRLIDEKDREHLSKQ